MTAVRTAALCVSTRWTGRSPAQRLVMDGARPNGLSAGLA